MQAASAGGRDSSAVKSTQHPHHVAYNLPRLQFQGHRCCLLALPGIQAVQKNLKDVLLLELEPSTHAKLENCLPPELGTYSQGSWVAQANYL